LDATESDMALARIAKGKISPVMTQVMGPQVEAKNAYKEKKIRALTIK
jgi:hypothetical protein